MRYRHLVLWLPICAYSFLIANAPAAPVAVNDAFSTAEDVSLTTGQETINLFTGDFEPGQNLAAGNWSFLDKVQNQFGTNLTYPVDGQGRTWKELNFDPASSTVGPWGSSAMPMQVGGINAIPGAPNVLGGIGGGTNGSNVVSTYLFRKVVSLDATTASIANWTAHIVADDGCIIYVNGQEALRVNMDPASYNPQGALTTNTFTANANEDVYADLAVNLSGKLVAGQNVIAIELHQTHNTSTDAGIDLSLTPAGMDVADEFVGVDDPFFGTTRPDYSAQDLVATGGYNGSGGAKVLIGNIRNGLSGSHATSGGWRRTFSVATAGVVQISFRYRMIMAANYEATEYGEIICDVDGTAYGTTRSPSTHPSVEFNLGNRNGGSAYDSGWKTANFQATLSVGSHTLTVGAYNNGSTETGGGEQVEAFFDDIGVSVAGGTNGLLANDTGADRVEALTQPAHGTLTLSADGSFTYVPALNFHGSDSFTYRAGDGVTWSSPATVSLTVTAVNDVPVAAADSYSTPEDTPLTVAAGQGVLANDTDADAGTVLTALLVSPPQASQGSVILNSDGSFTFTPAADYAGTATFTYVAKDGTADSTAATVTIQVTPVNDPPVGVADSYTTERNTTLTITSPGGVSVTENLILGTVRDASNIPTTPGSLWKYWDQGPIPSGSEIEWNTLDFDDSTWKEGASELGYGDGPEGGDSFPQVTLIEDNPTPGYTSGVSDRYWTAYFRKRVLIERVQEITAVDLQVMRDDGVVLYFNGTEAYRTGIAANPLYNTAATNASNTAERTFFNASDVGTGTNKNWTGTAPTPALLVDGDNLFAAEVHQTNQTSTDLSFDVKLSITRLTNVGLLLNDTDPEGSPLTAQLVSAPAHGSLTLNADGTFSYTPAANYRGLDSFQYRVSDGVLTSAPVTVSIVVTSGANLAPVANADTYAATEDVPLVVDALAGLLANDTDAESDPLEAVLATPPAKGTLNLAPDGSFTYTPHADANGTDTFTYQAYDGRNSNVAVVTINIAAVNDPPVAVNDAFAVDPGQTLVVPVPGVLTNDTDVDSPAGSLSAQLVSGPAGGVLTLHADGSFSYAAPAAVGTYTFTYHAHDGAAGSVTSGTVTITVNGAPQVAADEYHLVEDSTLTVPAPGVLGNDSDPEGQPLFAELLVPPSSGTLTLQPSGAFTYTPAADFAGAVAFTYKAFDGLRESAPATVTLLVSNVNDTPVASNNAYTVGVDTPLSVAAPGILDNDTDADVGTVLSASLVATVSQGQLFLSANGGFVYTPPAGFTGTETFTYRVSDGLETSNVATVSITVSPPARRVKISEIMYYPAPLFPEPQNEEWIELHNLEAVPADISGWKFTTGVSYTFPTDTVIPAGGQLVVAANVAAFQAKFPGVTGVFGPWTGTLANSGEKLTLADATGLEINLVSYADAGDWAVRGRETTFNGWQWQSAAEGGGYSLELRNPNLDNDNGQNWGPSSALGGSPGTANSLLATDIAPIIREVRHFPAVPKSTEAVTISCELEDEKVPGLLSVSLFWRDATTSTPGAFQSMPMSGDGSGDFFAQLDPKADKTIIEFYISASDGTNTRTWPAPTTEGQNANCQYQVDNEVMNFTDSYYRLILTAAENEAFDAVSSSSDRQFNQTLIITKGGVSEIRYRSQMRIHGNSSRSHRFRPLRVTVPSDDRLDGIKIFNLNPKASYLQYLGMRIFEVAHLPASNAVPVELRRNGVEYAYSTGSTPDYGKWVRMEEFNSDTASDHWPNASGGNLYKKGRNDYYWRSTQAAPSNPDGLLDGFSKQNNSSDNDWSDLTNFMSVWQTAAAPHFPGSSAGNASGGNGSSLSGIGNWDGTGFTPAEIASLETVTDFSQWAKWFAVMTILQDNETNISTGQDDDYACYFVPNAAGQRRMQLLPHDLDTIFGQGSPTTSYNTHGLFDATDDSNVFRILLPLMGNNTTVVSTAFRTQYTDALRALFGGPLNADNSEDPNPPFYALVDTHLSGWAPAATIASIKTYATQRQAYLLGLIGNSAVPPSPPTSIASISTAHGSLMLHEILADNVAAVNVGGLFPDIIELRNSAAVAVDLAGMSLTDDAASPVKFVFPAGSSIPAGGYLVLYADGLTGGNHLPFSLNNAGEKVTLFDKAANGGGVVDSIAFGLQAPDRSIGRTGANLNTWALCTPTAGAANVAVGSMGAPASLRINEILGAVDFRVDDDFVELYNPSSLPVALGNMALTDDPINAPFRFIIPPLSFMLPGAFVRFDALGDLATPGNGTELPFRIDGTFGQVALSGANGAVADRLAVVSQPDDVSTGRAPDGSAITTRFVVPTPGASNATPPANVLNLVNGLRISEIHFNPPGGNGHEFIELYNAGPVALELAGVRFTEGITFTFSSYTLEPGAYVVVVKDLGVFQGIWGASLPVAGVYTGSLSNGGEDIALMLPPPYDIFLHKFEFKDSWEASADGLGNSLQIVNLSGFPGDWDEKAAWQSGPPSPGGATPFGVHAGADVSILSPAAAVLDGSLFPGAHAPAAVTLQWSKVSGPGTVTFTSTSTVDTNAACSAPGLYVLRLTATGPDSATAADEVQVLVGQSYEQWAAAALASVPSQSGKTDDPDRDGVPNLLEYATGHNPLASDSAFTLEVVGDQLSIRFQTAFTMDPSIEVVPEISGDLLVWSYLPPVRTGQTTTAFQWLAQDPVLVGTEGRKYIRLKVISP